MKLLVVSDIHGSAYYTREMLEIKKRENPEKIILLGDLYYHGPRNPLPREYAPMEVANILNSIKEELIVIKGNCDAEVDEMISEFKFNNNLTLKIKEKKVFFTHGNKNNMEIMPKEKVDIMIYGHFHTGFIVERKGIVFANPGSISLPKNNTTNTYLIVEEEQLSLKDINGCLIENKKIN